MEELFPELQEEKHLRAYVPGPFIVAGLPARDVKNLPFKRKYNNITLTLTGIEHVPYGKYGRLLLSIITTHAVLSKNSGTNTVTIEYNSLNQLLKELQLPRTRGKEIRDQLEYFSKATFVFEEKKTATVQKHFFKNLFDEEDYIEFKEDLKATKVSTGVIPFMSHFNCLDVSDANSKSTVAITIELSNEFTKYSREHSVPIDYTVYKEISSPIGKDLYSWLMYRCNSLCDNDPLFIPSKSLIEQFMPVGEDSARNQEWRNYDYLKGLIQQIKEKYLPNLNISIQADGITLKKSDLPQITDEHYVLITSDL
ncbi:MAG: plasmid encoded RepA protein [Treponema sp.]|nr:plasmid encoded RepA protein [Treponema sp.]